MTNEMNIDKLSELFAQIERAWLDHRDRRMVRDLSEKYPEFRDELCEFFEDLVLGPGTPTDEMAKAENRVSEWLSSTGLDIAAAAVASARSSHGTTTASLGKQLLKAVTPEARKWNIQTGSFFCENEPSRPCPA